jgi:hypothetical protein
MTAVGGQITSRGGSSALGGQLLDSARRVLDALRGDSEQRGDKGV